MECAGSSVCMNRKWAKYFPRPILDHFWNDVNVGGLTERALSRLRGSFEMDGERRARKRSAPPPQSDEMVNSLCPELCHTLYP